MDSFIKTSPHARLTAIQVIEIRKSRLIKTQVQMSLEYGITRPAIRRILTGSSYKYVELKPEPYPKREIEKNHHLCTGCESVLQLNTENFYIKGYKFTSRCKPCIRKYNRFSHHRARERKLHKRNKFIEQFKMASSPIGVDIQAEVS